MADELTPAEALALWGLLARQGRAKDAEVKPKAARDALVGRGLVSVEAKAATLTDRGWRWASDHLDAPALDKQPVLALFLARLGEHLAKSGATLADVIGEAPPPPAPPAKKAAPKPKAAELRALIEAAYLRATGGARAEPVRLSRLRAELAPLDRKTVDAGLARIVKAKRETARLGQIDDNKSIDAAEREAAFSPAGEPFHVLWIQS